ncbi:hypothetical protein ACYOEI_36610, partial [Singulisphaera rosea]
VATFTGLSLDKVAYGIQASATGLTSATTAITVGPAATQLAITPPQGTVTTGSAFSLTVTARYPNGDLDPNYTGLISLRLSSNPNNATLSGTLSVQAVNGVATFTGLSLDKVAYGIQASATGLTSATTAITVVPAATHLSITMQPSNVTTGQPFSLTVTVEDTLGNVDPNYFALITLSLSANPSGGILSGSRTAYPYQGVARFYDLSLYTPGSGYLITASTANLTSATSSPITATSLPPQLTIRTPPPSSVQTGRSFSLSVIAKDVNGNQDQKFSGPVTLSLAANPGNGMLSGTLTVNAVYGIATFTGLSLNKSGSGYLIQATASGRLAVTTSAITVVPTATRLAITTPPPSGMNSGEGFSLVV